MGEPLVRLTGVSKRFGAVQALVGVGFSVFPGEVHVVLGENGAGKTSLMSVLAGLYRPDEGRMEVGGRTVHLRSPADALRHGIALVPQHVELVGNLTVWENVVLGHEGSVVLLNRARARERVRHVARTHGIAVEVDARVDSLSAGEQQKVEILKMLYRSARILILDEPTTFLTPQETDTLLQTLTRLATRGLGVILVTHKLQDALRVGHRLTVMRAGRVVASVPSAGVDESALVAWLMGAEEEHSARLLRSEPLPPVPPGAPVLLELAGLRTRDGGHRVTLRDIRLTLRQGEILGVAGVAGSGQRELAEAILGLVPVEGRIRLRGTEVQSWPVARRLEAGLALIPEDRIAEGILPELPLTETLVLGLHRRLFPGLRFRVDRAEALAAEVIRAYEVKAPGGRVPTAHLSGGNMQKVLVARAVEQCRGHASPVLIAVNPTRGLDIRTVRQVRDRLRAVAAGGGAVLFVSEDIDELMEECHRVTVLHQGRLVAQFEGPRYDRYRIGEAMLGRREEVAG